MRKKTAALVITFLAAVAIVFCILAVINIRKAQKLEYYARANTQHAFDELVDSMWELSNSLEKSVYTSDPALQSALCTQAYGNSVVAQVAMGVLPYESQEIEQAAGFVAKTGDYACSLAKSVAENDGYSEEELETLQSLSETATVLSQNLQELQTGLNSGAIRMASVYEEKGGTGGGAETTDMSESLLNIQSEFPELPTLIYDGPFSESIRSSQPRLLEGMNEVDQDTARETVAAVLALSARDVEPEGDCAGDVPCWRFTASCSGGDYTVSVTKQGGVIQSILCSRPVGSENYSVSDGLRMAGDYLAAMGLESMEESYHIVQGGVLTVNYEYVQDGVRCYPDLVKVGVALDNGGLMSYDAAGYIAAHRERTLPEAAVGQEEAEAGVSEALTIDSTALSIIPTEGGEEKLCYELVCTPQNGRRCILYVNAVTGREERILLLLEDDNGSLTI